MRRFIAASLSGVEASALALVFILELDCSLHITHSAIKFHKERPPVVDFENEMSAV
jgi:hypothetical protein